MPVMMKKEAEEEATGYEAGSELGTPPSCMESC